MRIITAYKVSDVTKIMKRCIDLELNIHPEHNNLFEVKLTDNDFDLFRLVNNDIRLIETTESLRNNYKIKQYLALL